MNLDPTPAARGGADYRVLLARTAGLVLLAATAVVSLIAADLVGIAVLGAALAWLGVAVARRELRIRRRLADTGGTRPAVPGGSGPRVGPGEQASAPPALTRSDIDAGPSGPDGRSVAHDPSVTGTVRGGTP